MRQVRALPLFEERQSERHSPIPIYCCHACIPGRSGTAAYQSLKLAPTKLCTLEGVSFALT